MFGAYVMKSFRQILAEKIWVFVILLIVFKIGNRCLASSTKLKMRWVIR